MQLIRHTKRLPTLFCKLTACMALFASTALAQVKDLLLIQQVQLEVQESGKQLMVVAIGHKYHPLQIIFILMICMRITSKYK